MVHVAYLHNGPEGSSSTADGLVFHHLRARNNYDPLIIWQLIRLVRCIKPDILHTWILQMDILGGIVSHLTRTPYVLREPSSGIRYRKTWKYALRTACAKYADVIVSNSSGGNQYWQDKYPQIMRYVIPNGLPLKDIARVTPSSPAEVGFLPNQKYLIYAGRLEAGKNLQNLIKAFSKAMAETPIAAVLCGDGPLRKSVDEQIRNAGLAGRVRLTGYIPSARVWSSMKGASAFVFMSEFEGLPNVVLEAMACGCPLVVSDIPAHREFLNETMALLPDPYNPPKIAIAILQSLRFPERTCARADAARKKAQEYSIPAMAGAYLKVYEDVLSRRQK